VLCAFATDVYGSAIAASDKGEKQSLNISSNGQSDEGTETPTDSVGQDTEGTKSDWGDPESLAFVKELANLAAEKKGTNIRALHVYDLVNYTDWFLVISARSDRQVSAIWQHINDTMRGDNKRKALSIEGSEHNQWVIMDYGEAVVHVFYEPVRAFYELETLWSEAGEFDLELPDDEPTHATPFGY